MDSWVEQLNRRARMVIDQIVAARVAAGSSKLELGWLEAQYRVLLEQLYAEEYAPARLRDTSDLIVRAEGPGADHDGPSLQSFTWLSDHIRRQLANLSRAVIPLSGADSKAVARKLGWTLTGYAPGSIMMGFALREPKSVPGFEKSDAQAFNAVRCAAQSIATIPQYVGETDIEIGLTEQIADPALRDAAIIAACDLAPTARSGIHTVEVTSRMGSHGSLSQRERMVLKKSIASPLFRKSEVGSFVGRLSAADLDKQRMTLRDVAGVGSIRCAISPELVLQMQKHFGSWITVSGRYEADREGKPRMMRVEHIETAVRPSTLRLELE